jgi:hypothetical protein
MMKMISSTNMTSINGVMLMSETTGPRRYLPSLPYQISY